MMLAGVSCSKGNDADQQFPRELCDSISMYSGRTLGAYVLSDYLNYSQTSETTISKNDILKGIQLAFANADNQGVAVGLQVGVQFLGQIQRFEEEGIDINRNEVLKYFRQVFEADTFSMENLAIDNGVMNSLITQVQQIKENRERASQENQSQEAQQADAAYLSALKSNDPDIQTSSSGLSYKIITPGSEPFVNDNSQIYVNYVGRLSDGTVFDQTQDQPAVFSPGGVIPGFAEGLKMLGKGGKAVLYIPGDLAYGPQGVPQIGIGPNAMLIFDVEIVDVR